jgi:hypothetical protein
MPPASNKLYRVQVGSYRDGVNAQDAYYRAQQAGFCPEYEYYGDYIRVVILNVRGSDMSSVAQSLGGVGFVEILVKD